MARHLQGHLEEIESIKQHAQTISIMAWAETGFVEWHEEGEDIHGNHK
jgi:hypothetical protein